MSTVSSIHAWLCRMEILGTVRDGRVNVDGIKGLCGTGGVSCMFEAKAGKARFRKFAILMGNENWRSGGVWIVPFRPAFGIIRTTAGASNCSG